MKFRHRSLNTPINTNIPDFNATKLHGTPTVIPPKNLSSSSRWLDLALFLMTGGREHSETEERELLAAAGFKLTKVIYTQSPSKGFPY